VGLGLLMHASQPNPVGSAYFMANSAAAKKCSSRRIQRGGEREHRRSYIAVTNYGGIRVTTMPTVGLCWPIVQLD